MSALRWVADSVEATQARAIQMARVFRRHVPPGLLLGLVGDLGAGKTAFTQGFVGALTGAEDLYVTSPTFAIAQIYPSDPPVVHMDLYRLDSLEALEEIGYRDHYFGNGITVVEWIDRVPEAIPSDWVEIRLAVLPSDAREICVHPHGARSTRLVAELAKV